MGRIPFERHLVKRLTAVVLGYTVMALSRRIDNKEVLFNLQDSQEVYCEHWFSSIGVHQ